SGSHPVRPDAHGTEPRRADARSVVRPEIGRHRSSVEQIEDDDEHAVRRRALRGAVLGVTLVVLAGTMTLTREVAVDRRWSATPADIAAALALSGVLGSLL